MKWTFASLEGNWEYEVFDTKREAIAAGKIEFDSNFLIGELHGTDLEYQVENIEEVECVMC